MKTIEEVREWCKGQFYCELDDENETEPSPCEAYELWDKESLKAEVERMVESLCRRLKIKYKRDE